jgi:hypothetical protein
MTAQREMTLEEYCAKLPESHRANVEYRALKAQPAQEPVALMDALKDAFYEGFASVEMYNDTVLNSAKEAWAKYTPPAVAQPEQERNFCPRCGKRTKDLTVIHTCTPPRENT